MAEPPAADLVEQLLATLRIGMGDTVLDVGSGTGSMVDHVLRLQPGEVIACDLSAKMLETLAKKHPNTGNLRLLHADARDLPLADAAVDVVICNGVYPHFADRLGTLRELNRVARPGARLAISHFGGREFVNSIHSATDNEVIRKDLIEPAAEVADLLQQAGFVPTALVDTERFFLVGGTKADG
jgi:ubiquinone/menaquinone biosynthesis C-methylase UbiE